jgi:lipopolysaccharide export LptBFGC system permease protein LptF
MSLPSSGSLFSKIKTELEHYIDARTHLLQLETIEKVSKLIGVMSVVLFCGVLFILFMVFLSLTAGFYFSSATGSYFFGFSIVAGFYLFLFIIVSFAGRKKLATFITNSIIKTLFERTSDNEE